MHKYSMHTRAAIYSKKQILKNSCLEDHISCSINTHILQYYITNFFQFCYANMQINELNHRQELNVLISTALCISNYKRILHNLFPF